MVSQENSSFLSTEMFSFLVKKWHIDTRNLYIRKWHICRKNTFFRTFAFENNIHLKNRIIYMSRILLSKKVYVFFTYTKACCSIGDELLLLQNVPRPWYFTTFIAHAKFSFYYKCLQEMLIDSNMIILFCSVMSDMDDYK